jgi:hypothetical protein
LKLASIGNRLDQHQHREDIAKEVHASFATDIPLTIGLPWDGKLLPHLTSKETVDRLAVPVSDDGMMKLLWVPALPNETGKVQASAVFNLIEECGILGQIDLGLLIRLQVTQTHSKQVHVFY